MKFALNHIWKLDSPGLAFLSGLLQTLIVMFVVILNFFAIMLETNPMDITINFLAFVVVSELDNYYFESHGDSFCK